ncbi:MAG TPA: hypothetical protein VF885_12935 [Arthrobacter sp.]
MDALAGARSEAFVVQVVELLWREWSQQCPGLRKEDLRMLVDVSMRICGEHGFLQQGTVIDFARSMVKDNDHPMNPDQMTVKAQSILAELRARSLYERIQSVTAHQPRPAHEPADDGLQQG